MTPHKQLHRHDPDNGVRGDHFRTVIACLLDLNPAEVPHFCDGTISTDFELKERVQAFLAPRGLRLISIPWRGDLDEVMGQVARTAPDMHHLLMGESRNGSNHVVICKDGKIVHDPALDDAGIVGPERENDVYWVEFLAACRTGQISQKRWTGAHRRCARTPNNDDNGQRAPAIGHFDGIGGLHQGYRHPLVFRWRL